MFNCGRSANQRAELDMERIAPRHSAGAVSELEATRPLHVRKVSVEAPWGWLEAGWKDLWSAPSIGLTFGTAVAAAAVLFAVGLSRTGWLSLMLAMGCGFLLVGPLLAAGLYDASRSEESSPPLARRLRQAPMPAARSDFLVSSYS